MGLFYYESDKRQLKDRNDIVKHTLIPVLQRQGFVLRPLNNCSAGDFDREAQAYFYDLGRMTNDGFLELIDAFVCKGSKRIQISLDISKLPSHPMAINELRQYNRQQLGIPLNSSTQMQLRCNDYPGPLIFYSFHPKHQLGSYYSHAGYLKALAKLQKRIQTDMNNIDWFVQRWHKIHH